MRLHSGEVEATGWRIEKLTDLAQRLRDASPGIAGRPRLIAIDGRGGSGKTTLAQRLRVTVPRSWTVHTDDVAWNHAFFDWTDVIIENVLRPLHQGEAVQFRPQASVEHGRPGTIDVPAGLDVVWVEGTGIIREQLAPWIDASIWIQGDLHEQERRLVARDGDSPAQQQHIDAWLAEELPLLLREQPWHKATIIVAGTTHLDYEPNTEIVAASPPRPTGSRSSGRPSASERPVPPRGLLQIAGTDQPIQDDDGEDHATCNGRRKQRWEHHADDGDDRSDQGHNGDRQHGLAPGRQPLAVVGIGAGSRYSGGGRHRRVRQITLDLGSHGLSSSLRIVPGDRPGELYCRPGLASAPSGDRPISRLMPVSGDRTTGAPGIWFALSMSVTAMRAEDAHPAVNP
jgi:hypothetical protein